jgi:hypothetical protein
MPTMLTLTAFALGLCAQFHSACTFEDFWTVRNYDWHGYEVMLSDWDTPCKSFCSTILSSERCHLAGEVQGRPDGPPLWLWLCKKEEPTS